MVWSAQPTRNRKPKEEKAMNEDDIKNHVRNLERLRVRISEVNEAAKRNPMSLDIARLETSLAKQWNRLVSELKAAGVEGYEPKAVTEEEPQDLNFFQQLFVESGLDIRDLTRKDEPPRSMFCDGWGF
jgi:hypothetical protein